MKAKTRRLVVEGVEYRVRVHHEHRTGPGCGECFTAFRAGRKTSPLRLHFFEGPDVLTGYPVGGTIFVGDASYNLNLPRNAAALIRLGLARGWAPERERTPFEVANGFEWLAELEPGLH